MEQTIGILGSGSQAIEIASYLNTGTVLGFYAVSKKYIQNNSDMRIIDIDNPGDFSGYKVIVGVGAPALRKKMVGQWGTNNYFSLISRFSTICDDAIIGDGTLIAPGVIITTNATLGDHVLVNIGTTINHDCNIGNFVTISPGVHIAGNVQLGDGVFVGIGAVLSNGVAVAPGCVIGAGAVILEDIIHENSVVVGVPEKSLSRIRIGYMSYKVPFIKPDFPTADEIASDYTKILQSNWFTNFGPFERKFSEQLGHYIGPAYYAATFSSATAGLIASILAVLGRGNSTKYILLPSFTFAAGADAIIWCGYKPLFVDIELEGFHMDIDAAENVIMGKAYRDQVKAVLLCNAFGVGNLEIDAWENLAERVKLPLMIDSAAGFGSLYSSSRKVGSAGLLEVFSFHATKPFAIGEGGAVISRNKKLIQSLVSIQNFGFENRNATQLGFNGKLQEINAAIGLRKFVKFEKVLLSRQRVYHTYIEQLNSDRFNFQVNAENASLCFATVLVKGTTEDRDKYLNKLKNAGVDAKTYYSPSLHTQNYFSSIDTANPLKNTDMIDSTVLSLPVHDDMKHEDIKLVIDTLNN